MSITLNNSDFQCLQDQLLDLKTKNYELAEKNRRSQADFEAAKAKICNLQLKLEEQERDFEVTSTTLRREIEAVNEANKENSQENRDHDYEAMCKELMHEAKDLKERYEKSLLLVKQFDEQNKELNDKVQKFEEDNSKLKEEVESKQKQLIVIEKECKKKLKVAAEEHKAALSSQEEKFNASLAEIKTERDKLKSEVEKLTAEVSNFDSRIESQEEERKIQERKGLKIVKELKRQLALEKSRTETLQQRLENLLRDPPVASTATTSASASASASAGTEAGSSTNTTDLENRSRLSTSSSTNGTSSNGNGSNGGNTTSQDANSTGSWSFVPIKTKTSNQALNETLSLCSIDSEDRETVQQPMCDTTSEYSMQRVASSSDGPSSRHNSSSTESTNQSPLKQQEYNSPTHPSSHRIATPDDNSKLMQTYFSSPSYSSSQSVGDGMLIEEQAALVDRLTRLQHDKWMLEEKLSYMEQANSSLSEDLANKTDIIRNYFMEQALKAAHHHSHTDAPLYGSSLGGGGASYNSGITNTNNNNNSILSSRRTSFPANVNHLLLEKPSLKKVVDFLKERSQITAESENISREATKKMQLMLEETLIKCLKLQENLDFVTSELNRLKS